MRGRIWIGSGALVAALAVAAGAMGAHYLKERLKLPVEKLDTFETAVRYQMYHALGLILVGLLLAHGGCRSVKAAGFAFALGLLLFSGGIYAWLATEVKPFVMVVPIGGTAWIIGWVLLAIGAFRLRVEAH